MRNFTKEDVVPILNSLKKHYENILYEIWALNYHMRTQPSEVMRLTPKEREFWLDNLIKQREKESKDLEK